MKLLFLFLVSCLPESNKKNNNNNDEDHGGSSSLLSTSFPRNILEDIDIQIDNTSANSSLSTNYKNLIQNFSVFNLGTFLFHFYKYIKDSETFSDETKNKLLTRYGLKFTGNINSIMQIATFFGKQVLEFSGDKNITLYNNRYSKKLNDMAFFLPFTTKNTSAFVVPAYYNTKENTIDGNQKKFEYYYCQPIHLQDKGILVLEFNLSGNLDKNGILSVPSDSPNRLVLFFGSENDFNKCFEKDINDHHSCLTNVGTLKILSIEPST